MVANFRKQINYIPVFVSRGIVGLPWIYFSPISCVVNYGFDSVITETPVVLLGSNLRSRSQELVRKGKIWLSFENIINAKPVEVKVHKTSERRDFAIGREENINGESETKSPEIVPLTKESLSSLEESKQKNGEFDARSLRSFASRASRGSKLSQALRARQNEKQLVKYVEDQETANRKLIEFGKKMISTLEERLKETEDRAKNTEERAVQSLIETMVKSEQIREMEEQIFYMLRKQDEERESYEMQVISLEAKIADLEEIIEALSSSITDIDILQELADLRNRCERVLGIDTQRN